MSTLSKCAIGVAVLVFLVFVWPTPYIYNTSRGEVYRTNRFSGVKERATAVGWR